MTVLAVIAFDSEAAEFDMTTSCSAHVVAAVQCAYTVESVGDIIFLIMARTGKKLGYFRKKCF